MSVTKLPFEKIKRELFVKRKSKTDSKFGCSPDERSADELINYGVVNINKPKGPTSHQVSAYVQKILNLKKSGHSGTLDPKVTGVLPVALGRATRIVQSLLKAGGLVYISTPNKFSPINIVCDPHFSLPVISLLKRKYIKKILTGYLKWQPADRKDFPELLSLYQLYKLLHKCGFNFRFVNRQVAQYAFKNPKSVWNRNFHLYLVSKI